MAPLGPTHYVAPLPMGVVYGLLAAVLWGTADFFARLAAERVGSRRTTFFMQCVALVCSSTLLLAPGAWPREVHASSLALACFIGLLNASGAAMIYHALEIGTVSLVSPISSAFASITAVLAIGAGEQPERAQLAGLVATVAGVAGASAPFGSSQLAGGERPRGVGLAISAAAAWGLSFFLLRYIIDDLGVIFPVVVSRAVAIVALGAAARAAKAKLTPPRGAWGLVVAIAIADSGAFIAYNRGIATSLTAVVSIVSSLFSAVTVLLAFIVLRERLLPKQWAFVALILAGLALVSSAA